MKAIDFHTHPVVPTFRRALEELAIDPVQDDGFPLPDWSEEMHLQFMECVGIAHSVLSLPSPHIYNGDTVKSVAAARAINEAMSRITRRHPEKFSFMACLPLPAIEPALAEISFAMDELGALGVKVPTNSYGVYLGAPALDGVMEELNRRHALVIIHPNRGALPEKRLVVQTVAALYDYPVETTKAVLNMVAHNIMIRYPHIRFVVPHCGSFLPYMASRMDGISAILTSLGMMEPVDVYANLKNVYYDIAGDPEPHQLDMLLCIAREGHILFGSDFPHAPAKAIIKKKKDWNETAARFFSKR